MDNEKRRAYDEYVAGVNQRWRDAGWSRGCPTVPSFGEWTQGVEAPEPPPAPPVIVRPGVVSRDPNAGVRVEGTA